MDENPYQAPQTSSNQILTRDGALDSIINGVAWCAVVIPLLWMCFLFVGLIGSHIGGTIAQP
jgi:hypothetical protein